jgi:hypothetical protein
MEILGCDIFFSVSFVVLGSYCLLSYKECYPWKAISGLYGPSLLWEKKRQTLVTSTWPIAAMGIVAMGNADIIIAHHCYAP